MLVTVIGAIDHVTRKKSIAVPRVCSDIILFPQSRVRRRQYCSYPGCKNVDNSIHIQDYGFQNVGLKEANTVLFHSNMHIEDHSLRLLLFNTTMTKYRHQWKWSKKTKLVSCLFTGHTVFMRCRFEIILILFLNIY